MKQALISLIERVGNKAEQLAIRGMAATEAKAPWMLKDYMSPALNGMAKFGGMCAAVIAAPFIALDKVLTKVL